MIVQMSKTTFSDAAANSVIWKRMHHLQNKNKILTFKKNLGV